MSEAKKLLVQNGGCRKKGGLSGSSESFWMKRGEKLEVTGILKASKNSGQTTESQLPGMEELEPKINSRKFPKPPKFTHLFDEVQQTLEERKSSFPKPPKVQMILLRNIVIDEDPGEPEVAETGKEEFSSI